MIDIEDLNADQLSDYVIVIHEDGFDLFETGDPNDEEVTRFVDGLGKEADTAAFNADAHPDHPSVEMVDSAYETLEVRKTLREARRTIGVEEVAG